jgi:hypothetical protein
MMAARRPHASASYRIIPQKDLTYGVEVTIPDTYPTLVTGFATEQRADAWIAEHKSQAQLGIWLKRRSGRPPSAAAD